MNNPPTIYKLQVKNVSIICLKMERKNLKRIRFLPPNDKTGSNNSSLWGKFRYCMFVTLIGRSGD